MIKNIFPIVLITITCFFTNHASGQNFPKLDVSPMDAAIYPKKWKNTDKVVKVVYSRPQLKGRMLSRLAPLGKVWRTGANEATEITFFKDVIFGGKAVKAGTYSLFTIPQENNWVVILNVARNVWGSYLYKESEDVVRVLGTITKTDETIEAFSITFDKEMKLQLGWENTVVSVAIEEQQENNNN